MDVVASAPPALGVIPRQCDARAECAGVAM